MLDIRPGMCYTSKINPAKEMAEVSIAQNKQGVKVLVTGGVLQLFLGIIYVWSVFVAPVSAQLDWAVDKVKLTTSFMLSFFVIGILLGGRLLPKLGAQKIVLIGGLMLAAGMCAAAFVPPSAAWLIYIAYGVVGGFGVGAAYNAVISCAQKWFPQNRGFATGISVCAFGFSTVVFAPLVEWMIKSFTVKYTFLLLSGAFLLVVLAMFSFIKLPDESGAGSASAALLEQRQYTLKEALATKEFYFITLSLMLGTAAFFILNPSLKDLAGERGLADSMRTGLVMLTGVANALGRLGVPLLSDKIGRGRGALLTLAVTAGCAAALIFVKSYAFMGVVALIAFCYGGYSGIYPVLTADHFGIKNVGSNYGAVMVGFAFSALVFPLGLRLIDDITVKFVVLAGLAAVGAALVAVMAAGKKKQ